MAKETFESLVTNVQKALTVVRELESNSLTEYTRASRVEPLTLIDQAIEMMDPDIRQSILQTLLSIYAGYYLQAVSLSGTVGNIKVLSILDQFSTDRDPLLAPGSGWMNLHDVFVGNESLSLKAITVPGNEAADKSLHDRYANLAVGKSITVNVTIDGKTFPFDATVRLIPQILNKSSIIDVLSLGSKDNSMKGRWLRWKAGELSLADYLLAKDMIESDKKGLLNDKHGLYEAKKNRKMKSFISALLSGNPSLNVSSSITVITRSTAKELEVKARMKLSRARDRQRFFEDTQSMMLCVVDPSLEAIQLYYKGISEESVYTFDDISKNNTNPSGVNINQVLEAYRAGKAPGL